MAASHAGHAAVHAGSPAKIRPIPTRGRKASGTASPATVTAGRTTGVGRPTRLAGRSEEATRLALVAEAAASALDGLVALERHARDVADAFRWRHVGPARQGLADLVDSTQTLLKLAVMSAQAARTDLLTLCKTGNGRADEQTQRAADRIIQAQLAGDWPALAHALDQDFVAALGLWREVFETLVSLTGDGAPGGQAA
jgi:hypothetical protein